MPSLPRQKACLPSSPLPRACLARDDIARDIPGKVSGVFVTTVYCAIREELRPVNHDLELQKTHRETLVGSFHDFSTNLTNPFINPGEFHHVDDLSVSFGVYIKYILHDIIDTLSIN